MGTAHRPGGRRAAFAAASILLMTVLAVAGWSQPAAAASGPVFTGGQVAAPYTGVASHPSVASSGTQALTVWHERVGTTWGIFGRISSATTDTIGPKITIALVSGKNSMYPDVAWNGTNWLAVWQYSYSSTDLDIRAALVSTSGVAGGIFSVEGNTAHQLNPAVSAGKDGEFYVVWEDQRNPTTTLSDIYGRRITGAGAVDTAFPHYRLSYDLQGIQTADTYPDIAYYADLDVFALVYEVGGSSIRYRDFDDTTLYTGQLVVNHDSAHPATLPKLASSGRDVLIVYVDNKAPGLDISAVMFGNAGNHSFPITTSSTGNETQPTVAFNGNFMVAWKDTRNDSGGDIYGTRVKKDRTVLDTNGFVITEFTPADEYPAVGKGTNKAGTFTVAWNLNPNNQGTGIALYGIDYPAPK
jgi:hypothetical protein